MSIYFTSDTHFSQARTLQLSKRPFENIEQMDSIIIQNWNNTVNQNDTVFHLGDFGNLEYLSTLTGKIVLLVGNYERDDPNFKNQIEPYVQSGKVEVKYKPFVLTAGGQKFRLTHQPSLKPEDRKYFQLFGHIHRLQMVKKNALNVGVDCNHFRLFSLEDVLWQKNGIINHYDQYVFCE